MSKSHHLKETTSAGYDSGTKGGNSSIKNISIHGILQCS